MSDKPDTSTLPRWADVGGAVVNPVSGKKDIGWEVQEKPPAQWFNWLLLQTYLWLLWVSDGRWTRASLTDNSPVVATTDRDGRVRHYLGPEGYWMGPAVQSSYFWSDISGSIAAATDVSLGDKFHISNIGASSAVTVEVSPEAAFGASVVVINPVVTGAGNEGAVLSCAKSSNQSNFVVTDLDNRTVIVEGTVGIETVSVNSVDVYWGLSDLNGFNPDAADFAGAASRSVLFVIPFDTAAFEVRTSNGAATAVGATDTANTVVVDTMYTLRVEYHGANTPLGVNNSTAAIARFFIDGLLVHEETANMPTGANWLGPCFGVHGVDSGGADQESYFGPTKLAWSPRLTGDIPA